MITTLELHEPSKQIHIIAGLLKYAKDIRWCFLNSSASKKLRNLQYFDFCKLKTWPARGKPPLEH